MDQRQAILKLNDEITKAMRVDEETYTGAVTSYYDEFLARIQADLMAMYSRVFRGGTLNYQDYQRLKMKDHTLRIIQPALSELQKKTVAELDVDLTQFYWDAYKRNAWALDQTTPPNVDISMMRDKRTNLATDPLLSNLIAQQVMAPFKGAMFSDRLGHINETMAEQIGIMTRQAALNGWSVPDLSAGIRDLVGVPPDEKLITRPRASAAKSRADMIARTELMRAMNLAKADLLEANDDLVEDKKWLAADDARTCDDCMDMDGLTETELEDQGFDTEMPAHPRCRCTWVPVLKTWKELLGPELGKDMGDLEHIDEFEMKYFNAEKTGVSTVKVMPYEEWAKVA
jgi:SPP1 gp7 family putative phage head morphogenesis protein